MLSKSIIANIFYWHGEEIAEEKYNNILKMIKNKPIPPTDHDYRLTIACEWELYKLPVVEEETDIATEEDYI